MRLTEREIEMIRDVPRIRTNRKRAAWAALVTNVVLLAGVRYFEYDVGSVGLLLAVFVGLSIAGVARQYFAPDPNDRFVDLLLRYVDDDPDALAQLYGEQRLSAGHHDPERVSTLDS